MPDEYQIKLAASRPEVPVNFLVEIILGVSVETLEKNRPQFDPNKPWGSQISLLPGAGSRTFIGSDDDLLIGNGRGYVGWEEWIEVRAYIFLTQCMTLKFDLKESELLANKVPTFKFAQWVKHDKILERLEDMEADVCEQAVWFIDFALEEDESTCEPQGKNKNQGGPPAADATGEIAEKIAELKVELDRKSSGYGNIPWDIRFTKCVQKLKKDKIIKSGKIKKEELYHKVPPSTKGKDYTALVGISTDTVKYMIKNPTK